MKRGIAKFTLDGGRCPPYLFERMVKLGREMVRVLVAEYGPDEFVQRISDPVWFQSLGTVLAFDWNASGLTTTLTAALKEAIRGEEKDLGLFICGGKGATSRKTPNEIINWGEKLLWPESSTKNLVYNSRMSAKVDSALIQDGYNIYHHAFFFSSSGTWAVVQQGMNIENSTARRYHWFSDKPQDLINEPHSGIVSQARAENPLDLTANKSQKTRDTSLELVQAGYKTLMNDIKLIRKHNTHLSQMMELNIGQEHLTLLKLANREFHNHPVEYEDFSKSKYLEKILWKICDIKPRSYEHLLALEGVGAKTMRALALVSEVIYGAKPSYQDPARYSFAHGGKDGTPYFINKERYDQVIQIMMEAVRKMKTESKDKDKALNRLQAKLIEGSQSFS